MILDISFSFAFDTVSLPVDLLLRATRKND
ncbi:MAG: YceK/YidQ family lipoprotein [Planctomycetes bacterium]|nr:YceK/YidQ family lipoprotein [Planctomycetota bacterium]